MALATVCFYQGGEEMVEDEIDGHHGSPGFPHRHQGLIHHVYPALLRQDLEHGHERLHRYQDVEEEEERNNKIKHFKREK